MQKKTRALGTLEDSSPEQLQVVARLRVELKDRLEQFPDLKTTWNLLRFCRARDFDYDRVKLMLENSFPLPVKAAGGVRTYDEAVEMIQLGRCHHTPACLQNNF